MSIKRNVTTVHTTKPAKCFYASLLAAAIRTSTSLASTTSPMSAIAVFEPI